METPNLRFNHPKHTDAALNKFFRGVYLLLKGGVKQDKRKVDQVATSVGIEDRTLIKEISELAIVYRARELALSPNKVIRKYEDIVHLYYNQVNLSHRTSQSMMLQQYSTAAPIAFLAGVFAGLQDTRNHVFEPSAGNGLLTIAAHPQQVTVNEIDTVRSMNLKVQGYKNVLHLDASAPFRFFPKQYDAVITNPPFGKAEKEEIAGYKIDTLDHLMAIYALDTMKDNGRAAIIIGGHTEWDELGRIKAGKNRIFFNYLHEHYQVDDTINIDGKKLYSRQGTGFNVRIILISGRKATPAGVAPMKKEADRVVSTFDELYNRVSPFFPKESTTDNEKKLKMLHLKARAAKAKLLLLNLNGLGMPYTPTSNACVVLDTHVPDMMAHETFSALAKIKEAVGGDIDRFVQHRLGYKTKTELCAALAAEQIDAVAMAIYNIEARNQGMIIGDQTGIGKGRQAAAIIRYARLRGKVPVFISEKTNLFTDMHRDLTAIGSSQLVPFIVNAKDPKTGKTVEIKDEAGTVVYKALSEAKIKAVLASQKLPAGYDYIVSTYTQFNSEERSPLKPGFLRAVAKDNVLILDESHNASGSSQTGTFLQEVTAMAEGVVFLSATYAKRSDNMPIYAMKTAMSDANLSPEELVEAISKGGVALQEVLSAQLVAEGQMIRRERGFEGIEVNYINMDAEGAAKYGQPGYDKELEHRAIADNITSVMRDIITFQAEFVTPEIKGMDKQLAKEGKEIKARGGTSQAGVRNSPYFSKLFQVINQMLFAIKAESIADRAIERLREGKKPVIGFASTMESFIHAIGAGHGDEISLDFTTVLQKGLDGVLRYTVKGHKGDKSYEEFSVNDLGPSAQMEYFKIAEKLRAVSSGIAISPIDVIKQRIEAAGFRVLEVTGRQFEVQLDLKKNKGLVLNRKKESTADAYRMFNNNEADCLMINQSGSTGASAHALPTKVVPASQVKQRVMIIGQPELDINTEIQKRGRINRTGQILPPIYDYISSAIPAEKRLMMMLQKKLKSLDANTSSNQKQSESVMSFPDFLNKYGDKVVEKYLEEDLELNFMLGDPLKVGDDEEGNKKKEDGRAAAAEISLASQVSGRVAVLSTEMQQKFYDDVTKLYNIEIEDLKRKDEYDLEVEAMALEAETISKTTVKHGKSGSSAFADDTVMETCWVNVLKKPYTALEIQNMLVKELNGSTPGESQAELQKEYDEYIRNAKQKEKSDIIERIGRKLNEMYDEPRIKKHKDPEQRAEAVKERTAELEADRAAAIAKVDSNYYNRQHFMSSLFKFFYIGRGVFFPVGKEENAEGIFLGYKIDRKAKNIFTPSNVRLCFAVAHSSKYIEITASNNTEVQAVRGSSYAMSQGREKNMLQYWEEAIKASSQDRKIRHILTGNLLQGFGSFHGKLVSYTLKTGGEKKGILMPESYVVKENQSVSVPIISAIGHIKTMTNGQSFNTNREIGVIRQADFFRIIAPGTKTKGGWFFLDKDVLKLVDDGIFDKSGDKMVAKLQPEKIERMIELFQEKFTMTINVTQGLSDKLKTERREVSKEWKRLEVPKDDVKSKKLKLLELKAKAAKVKLLLLNIGSHSAAA